MISGHLHCRHNHEHYSRHQEGVGNTEPYSNDLPDAVRLGLLLVHWVARPVPGNAHDPDESLRRRSRCDMNELVQKDLIQSVPDEELITMRS